MILRPCLKYVSTIFFSKLPNNYRTFVISAPILIDHTQTTKDYVKNMIKTVPIWVSQCKVLADNRLLGNGISVR